MSVYLRLTRTVNPPFVAVNTVVLLFMISYVIGIRTVVTVSGAGGAPGGAPGVITSNDSIPSIVPLSNVKL